MAGSPGLSLRRIAAIVFAAGIAAAPAGAAEGGPTGSDAMIDDLIARMSLEEKVGQLTLVSSTLAVTGPEVTADLESAVAAGRVGAVFNAFGADYTRHLQRIAVEETRLGIPLLFAHDVLHGFRTVFPIPLGIAATFDPAAAGEAARVAAVEASAAGVHWTFAPMVDIARDPRWGRVAEGAGESPYLGALIAAAQVAGFQGRDLAAPDTVAATAKHFAGYGAAEAGRDYNTTDLSERVLRETYLPPFRAATETGVAAVMPGFNDLDGVPATANAWLIEDVLRGEWGFGGVVVSDYTAIPELKAHGIAADDRDAARLAFTAGTDIDMQGGLFLAELPRLVEAGRIPMASVDRAVRRVLKLKAALGLFDDPFRYSDPERERTQTLTAEHLDAARRIARQSLVLLENEGNVLPFESDMPAIAVIGPLAHDAASMLGPWAGAGDPAQASTLADGVRRAVAPGTRVLVEPAGEIERSSAQDIARAIAVAEKASAVVLALGERAGMSGEAASRADIGLPGDQLALARAVAATGRPIAVVLFSGRPLTLTALREAVPVLLQAWFPGTAAGDAIADVLFGRAEPTGRLPISFPRAVGQIPVHHDAKPTGRPASGSHYTSRYLDLPNDPLYPFGWGLSSYTDFEIGPPRPDRETLARGGRLGISVDVTNTGDRVGTETVQLYVRDLVGSVTRPVMELKGVRRVTLRSGETGTVRFDLTDRDLSFWRRDMTFGPEPGRFEVLVGPNAAETRSAFFELVGP